MLTRLLIPIAIAAQLVGGLDAAAAASGRRVAQAQPASGIGRQVATDRAAAGVARVLNQRDRRVVEKRNLNATWRAQLGELDRLKRTKASWRRDRQIRAKKAESQTTAARLSRVDAELRVLDAQLRAQRESLLAAIGRELADGATGAARRAALEKMRGQVMAVLRPRARKIILPDESLDELADQDELAEQIALIAQAEKELEQERKELRQREGRYTRWAVLREQRDRAGQMSDLDDEQVRRSTGRTGRSGRDTGGSGAASSDDDSGDSGSPEPGGDGDSESPPEFGDQGSPPPSGPDSSFETSSVVLADVVDSTTIDALRRAGRSTNPRARAAAAERARKQVESRLDRLRRSKKLIQDHLNKLRAQ